MDSNKDFLNSLKDLAKHAEIAMEQAGKQANELMDSGDLTPDQMLKFQKDFEEAAPPKVFSDVAEKIKEFERKMR